jgi:hypothetical protein
MRSVQKTVILGIAISVAFQCGGSEGDYVRSTSFKGVKGEIVRIDHYCYDGCMGVGMTGEESNPDTGAWVEAYRNGEIAGKAYTDEKGRFELPLEQGIYNLRIYPPQSFIDEEVVGIWITDDGGTGIRRTYRTSHNAWVLNVNFHADVEIVRIHEILTENNMKGRYIHSFEETIWYEVEIPQDLHVQDVREFLEQNYTEIESADLDYDIGDCAA